METRNRILVAEDELDTLQGLEKLLLKRGYRVDIARDGVEAVEKLKSKPFDVVVSDLKMPGLDGIGVLQKARETNKDVVFIMITAYGTVDNAVEAMRLGSFDYVSKPFSPSILIATIEKALQEEKEKTKESPLPVVTTPDIKAVIRYPEDNAWISVQEDGTVFVGADEKFYVEAGEILYCDLPFEGEKVVKGETCVSTTSAARRVHRGFRCPISGTVVKVNEIMLNQPWEGQKSPLSLGWLFAVVPEKLEEEIRNRLINQK